MGAEWVIHYHQGGWLALQPLIGIIIIIVSIGSHRGIVLGALLQGKVAVGGSECCIVVVPLLHHIVNCYWVVIHCGQRGEMALGSASSHSW